MRTNNFLFGFVFWSALISLGTTNYLIAAPTSDLDQIVEKSSHSDLISIEKTKVDKAKGPETISECVSRIQNQVNALNKQLKDSQSCIEDLQVILSTSQKELDSLRTEVQTSLASSQEKVEKLSAHLEMLRDYSEIPDNLYEGQEGIASNNFGKALKDVLEMFKMVKNKNDMLNQWSIVSKNFIDAIKVDGLMQSGRAKFVEVYEWSWKNAPEDELQLSLSSMDTSYQYPLNKYLRELVNTIYYINDKPKTRLLMFFDNVRLLILEMLMHHPQKVESSLLVSEQ